VFPVQRCIERGRTTLCSESGSPSLRKEHEVDEFIVLLASLLSFSFAVIVIIAARGSKIKQREENRRAARHYDSGLS
jgi:hypothetical protein